VKQSARSIALEVIGRVVDEGGYSTRVMPATLARSRLDVRDRAFATELVFGTLRHLIRLDRAIEQRASRPVARMTPPARNLLRVGTYQLLVAGIPPHAAVGETVGLSPPRERGFVNAVLRKLADDPPPLPVGHEDRDVAERTGLQPWGVGELRRLLGEEAEEAAAAIAAQAPLTLRVNANVTSPGETRRRLAAAGHESEPAPLDPACILVEGGDPATFPGFDEGAFAVQDQASAFVVRALDPQPGDRVLDACAAPGGKTAFLAELVGPEGLVVAADLHPNRAALIPRAARRLGVHPVVLAQDAVAPAVRGPFDRVLVDAPCTGIGSARRRPELLWRSRKGDLSTLARTQVAIASACAELLAAGGRLVYSVCTFPRAETDVACDAILRHRPDLLPIEIDAPDGPSTRVRLWPHRHGSDGMFVAAFVRSAAEDGIAT
jgi:16S rRNA (cytosine967-C5)-methyltransferase